MVKLLLGTNSYARAQAIDKLSDDYQQLVRLDGANISKSQLIQELGGQSLFSESNLVVVDNLSDNSSLAGEIDEILEIVDDVNGLVLVESTVDKRTKYYKTLKKQAEVVQCQPLKPDQAISFVRELVTKKGGKITANAARYLVERVGTDQQLLAMEVEKLTLIEREITADVIDRLSPPSLEDSAFALTDALAAGSPARAIELYKQLRLGGNTPPDIIGVLAWQLEVVALIVASSTSNQSAVARQSGLHQFVVKKNWQLASGLDLDVVKRATEEMLRADIAVKSSPTADDEIIEDLLIRLSALFNTE